MAEEREKETMHFLIVQLAIVLAISPELFTGESVNHQMHRSRSEAAQPEPISTLNFQSDVPPENRSQSDNNKQPPVRFQLCFFGGPSVIKLICPNLATL